MNGKQLPAPDERDELTAIVHELYAKDLITATGGNLSVRAAGRVDQLWVTPAAMFKGGLTREALVCINMDGEPLDDAAAIPSSERWVHTEILKSRPEFNAVIHTHAPWATLLALTETPFFPISVEAAFIGEVPRVPFILPGTRELAVAVAQALGGSGAAALMQNHGLVVAGSSLRRAASATEVIERTCELILRCLALGKRPPLLPEEIVLSLRARGQMLA
jgi:autoinducer 2 (AI-2) kinase